MYIFKINYFGMNPILKDFSPKLIEFNNQSKPKFPYKTLIIKIDVSGSTDNSYIRGGVRGEKQISSEIDQKIDSNDNKLKTKCILIAEMEGVSHVMAELANAFEISNLKIELCSFSSDNHYSDKTKINNSLELYNLALNLREHIFPELGGTNTLKTLKSSFDLNNNSDTLVIIATDGHPNDHVIEGDAKSAVISYMNSVSQYLKSKNKRLDMLVIGAGSIMESATKICARIVGRNDNLRGDYSQFQVSGSAECDIVFLHKLVDTSVGIGAYLPSYRDYSELKETTQKFIEMVINDVDSTTLSEWKVRLDSSLTNLPTYISDRLNIINNRESIIGFVSFILNKKECGGYYLFTKTDNNQGYQIRLNITSLDKFDQKTILDVSKNSYKNKDYIQIYSTKNDLTNSPLVVGILNENEYVFESELTYDGFAKIRQISSNV